MPVPRRKSCALRATLRGSLLYGSPVSGSCTKNVRFSVGCWRNGSSTAVAGSGSSSMSDSWICWNPRIEEPSNISPSAKTFSPKDSTGTVKCCTVPGRSQNLTSTNSTLLSPMNLSTSSAFVNIYPPWKLRPCSGCAGCAYRRAATTTLGTCRFRAVSRVFHACYAWGLGQLTDGDRTRGRRGIAARYRGWRVSFTGARRSGPREQVNLSRREVRAAGERVAVGREHGAPPRGPGPPDAGLGNDQSPAELDARGLCDRDLRADRAHRADPRQAPGAHPGRPPGRQAGRVRLVAGPDAAAAGRHPAPHHRPRPARPARPGGEHDRDPPLTRRSDS